VVLVRVVSVVDRPARGAKPLLYPPPAASGAARPALRRPVDPSERQL